MRKFYGFKFIFFFFFVFLFCFNLWAQKDTIVIGSISNTIKEEIATFQPFIEYLAKKLQPQGISKGKMVVVSSMDEMSEAIKSGQVDIYIDSPFPVLKVSINSGAKPFLRRWKKGVKEYRSVIFTRRDSGINSFTDLKGKIIGFEEPYSTSAYFLPKATLMKKGLNLVEKQNSFDEVSPDEAGYLFSWDDETTMVWVLRGKVSAGAISSQKFIVYAKGGMDELKIIEESVVVPRQVVCHRQDLNLELVNATTKILLEMNRDKEGREILKNFEDTTKFDNFPKGAAEALSPISELLSFIERELGQN
ncbi:MAG: phosphate/phosphite/phosphonate ABC transporter substrate-binding protein [Candidatus Omnitrophota bacterium]